MMAAVEERNFQGQPTVRSLKNVAKKSTTKPAQYLNSRAGSCSPNSNGSSPRDTSENVRVSINGQNKSPVDEHATNGLVSSHTENSVGIKVSEEGEAEDPVNVTRRQIEHLEKKQEEMMQTITGRSSPVSTTGLPDSFETCVQDGNEDSEMPSIDKELKDVDSSSILENSGSGTVDQADSSNPDSISLTAEKIKPATKLSIDSKVKDSFKGILKGVVEKLQSSKSTSSSPSQSRSSSANNSRSSSPMPTMEGISSNTPTLDKGNLFENFSNLTGDLDLMCKTKESSESKLKSPRIEPGGENILKKSEPEKDLQKDADAAMLLGEEGGDDCDVGDIDESILDKSDDIEPGITPTKDPSKLGEDVSTEKEDCSSHKNDVEKSSLENDSNNIPSPSEKLESKEDFKDHQTDDPVTKGENSVECEDKLSDNEESKPAVNGDPDVKDKTDAEITSDTSSLKNQDISQTSDSKEHIKSEVSKMKVDDVKAAPNISKKRSSSASPDRDLKKSRLDSMIGRLGSAIGIKPEEVEEAMEETTTSDSEGSKEDSSSTGDEDEKSEDSDKITMTTKELNAFILRRTEAYLSSSETASVVAALQARVAELQTSVEAWRSQAKELQKQMAEVAAKQQSRSERRRVQPPRVPTRNMSIQVDDQKVQNAMLQQGLISKGNTPPRTARTSAGAGSQSAVSTRVTIPSRTQGVMMVTSSSTPGSQAQQGPAVRNMVAKPSTTGTVRELLHTQRDVSKSSPGGTGSTPTGLRSTSAPSKGATAVKNTALKGGIIDLTDDDDLSSPPKTGTSTTSASHSVAVRQAVSGTQGLRPGTLLVQQTPNSTPMVLQQVINSPPIRTQQGTLVYTTARPGQVMVQAAPGAGLVRGTLVAASQPPQLRPAQQLVVRQATPSTTSSRLPPPLQSAPLGLKHPAPLPPVPVIVTQSKPSKASPPKPGLKISRVQQGIVLSWNMTLSDTFAEVSNYQLFAYQEGAAPPSTNLWKKVGDVKALPLPMACTLTQFQEGNKYHFAVRAVDQHGRIGPFSDPSSIHLMPAGASSTS